MSLDASIWAWRADVDSSSQRLVLLSLADRAGENHKCYPSLQRLIKDTKMNRKTIIKVLDELELKKFIQYTGEIRGNGVKVYQLIGVYGRETESATSTNNGTGSKNGTGSNLGTGSKNGTSTENGTSTSTKFGTATSTKNGTENLPMNLPIESKNKKTWLCLKKLREEISLCDSTVDFVSLIQQRWYHRELQAFENHNADKPLSDEIKIYHFADWLLNAKIKYESRQNQASAESKTVRCGRSDSNPKTMNSRQIAMFSQKLANHGDFGGKYADPKESTEQFAYRIAAKLRDPKYLREWAAYLQDVGFVGNIQGVA